MRQSHNCRERFTELYGHEARLARAPGRVNLIGEHTDYNGGFVMPAAIDLFTHVAFSPRTDRKIAVYSENFGEVCVFDLDDPRPSRRGRWSDYVQGVSVMLERSGVRLKGADLYIDGTVPPGSGLSSSAAVEVAAGWALAENSGAALAPIDLARICHRAENEFVGMRCGIMDQFISCMGRAGSALMLDCRSLEYRYLPLPDDANLVVANTMVRHELASSEYNLRRLECEAGVAELAKRLPGVDSLRDVTMDQLREHSGYLDSKVYRRCRHVITENERVLAAAAALESGELDEFGRLMNASHESLREDYEVSCEELDLMVELARNVEGVYGARMMGGGFGGSTINLVRSDRVEEFQAVVAGGYEARTGHAPVIYVLSAVDGAGEAPEPVEDVARDV
jgi:galactokinase